MNEAQIAFVIRSVAREYAAGGSHDEDLIAAAFERLAEEFELYITRKVPENG